jgi:hypothetical protein
MPLKILGHKTWNVWNKETLAKIDQDEREHEEKTQKERSQEADNVSAARLDILRNRVLRGDDDGGDAEEPKAGHQDDLDELATSSERPPQHVNLFQDFEARSRKSKGKERGHDKAAAKEEQKKHGIIGEASFGETFGGARPWYCHESGQHEAIRDIVYKGRKIREEKRKLRQDPMAEVMDTGSRKKKKHHHEHSSSGDDGTSAAAARAEAKRMERAAPSSRKSSKSGKMVWPA